MKIYSRKESGVALRKLRLAKLNFMRARDQLMDSLRETLKQQGKYDEETEGKIKTIFDMRKILKRIKEVGRIDRGEGWEKSRFQNKKKSN